MALTRPSRASPGRWLTGAIMGALVFGAGYVGKALLWAVVHDALPLGSRADLAARWETPVDVGGTFVAIAAGLGACVFIGRACDAPQAVRRLGAVVATSSALAFILATALVLGSAKPPAQPGAAPAGDVAPLFLAVLVGLPAVTLGVLGTTLWGAGWCWTRWRAKRQRRSPP